MDQILSEERMRVILNKLLTFIYDENPDNYEYTETLMSIGCTRQEVYEELTYSLSLDSDEANEILDELYD